MSTPPEPHNVRYESYLASLDSGGVIRNAWVSYGCATHQPIANSSKLYSLYLDPRNFESVAYRLYVVPCSSNYIVRASISKQLRLAAQKEVAGVSRRINVSTLYDEADKAFASLSTLLGDDKYFFDHQEPSLFDASVFAYTHLILDANLGWDNDSLGQILRQRVNLVRQPGSDHVGVL